MTNSIAPWRFLATPSRCNALSNASIGMAFFISPPFKRHIADITAQFAVGSLEVVDDEPGSGPGETGVLEGGLSAFIDF